MMYAQINEKSVGKPCCAQRTLKTELINDHGRSRSILHRHCSLACSILRQRYSCAYLITVCAIQNRRDTFKQDEDKKMVG